MNRYPKYKPTGIAWLPEVPEEWEMRPLKQYVDILPGYAFASDRFSSNGIRLLRGVNVGVGWLKWEDTVCWPDQISKSISVYELKVGDLICGLDRPWIAAGTRVAFVQEKDVPSLLLQRVCRIRSIGNIDLKWVYLWLSSFAFQAAIGTETTGISVPHISTSQIANFRVFLPPLPTQRAIVAYLDEKCGKVDRLVAAKEKEAALLKELKQSMIAEAVTGATKVARTDTARKMKPSGIPWLPEVPEGWKLVRNKTFLKLTDEKVGSRKNAFTLLSLTKQGVIVRDLTEMKGKFPKDFDTYLVVRPNNLVFCLFDVDETPRTVGLVKNVGMLTGAYTNFEVDQSVVLPEFAYYYYLHVDDAKKLRPYYTGLRKVVKTNTFMQLRMPVPSLAEQRAIVAYIEARAAKIDAAVKGLEREVAALKEYKQRLIADVVTGQRKVA